MTKIRDVVNNCKVAKCHVIAYAVAETNNYTVADFRRRKNVRTFADNVDKLSAACQNFFNQLFTRLRRTNGAGENVVRLNFVAVNVTQNGIVAGQFRVFFRRKFNVAVQKSLNRPLGIKARRHLRMPINFTSKTAYANDNQIFHNRNPFYEFMT